MKKWQQRGAAILAFLGFTETAKQGKLSAEEQKQFFAEYEKQNGISYLEDKKLNEDAEVETVLLSEEEITQLAATLGTSIEATPTTATAAVPALQTVVEKQAATIETLSSEPEVVAVPIVTANASQKPIVMIGAMPHSKTHLFGIETGVYAIEKAYNQVFVTRKPCMENLSKTEKEIMFQDMDKFAAGMDARYKQLAADNQIGLLDFNKMIAGQSLIDYSGLDSLPEFQIRRTDMILAYLRSMPSVDSIFPLVSGIQNMMVAPNASFGELSQGYRDGDIFKGDTAMGAEICRVTDLMFKYKFFDLVAIEKAYIGYLNREGSSVFKWTFIEWVLMNFATQLQNERNRRRVIGVAVPQQAVTANPAMLAADGAYRAIERLEEEFKVLPFADLNIYDDTDMLTYIADMWQKITEILPTDPGTEGYKVHANAKHKQWYVALYAEKYKTSTGVVVPGAQLPDLDPNNIVWVPNLKNNNYKVFVQIPGNIENYEDKPGEMTAFGFFYKLETVEMLSRWKEGSGARKPGVKYPTLAALTASGRADQWIFTNYPATALAVDATTIDGSVNNLFVTAANGSAKAITNITSAAIDTVYKIVCGSMTNATTIAKSGNFSTISAAFIPGAVGDYIKVYAQLEDYTTTVDGKTVTKTRATGKFLELERSITTS